MVRTKQQKPYHGTKENIESIQNTETLAVTNVITLPKRPFPPLLRFGVLINRSSNPESTKKKILESDFNPDIAQAEEIQQYLKEMTVLDLRTALNAIGLQAIGRKRVLFNRLSGTHKNHKKSKGANSRQSPVRPSSPNAQNNAKKESDGKAEPKAENSQDSMDNDCNEEDHAETKPEVDKSSDNEEESTDEKSEEDASESTSQYAKLKVMELRAELRKRGLNTLGRKEELIERLESDSNKRAAAAANVSSDDDEDIDMADDDDTDEYLGEDDNRKKRRAVAGAKSVAKNGHKKSRRFF